MKKIFVISFLMICFSCTLSMKSKRYAENARVTRLLTIIYFTDDLSDYSTGISNALKEEMLKRNIPISIELVYGSRNNEIEKNESAKKRKALIDEAIKTFHPEQVLFISPKNRTYNGHVLQYITYMITLATPERDKVWQGQMFISALPDVNTMKNKFTATLFDSFRKDGLILNPQ